MIAVISYILDICKYYIDFLNRMLVILCGLAHKCGENTTAGGCAERLLA